jgi:outer membrane lipoprotein SlyB
MADNRLQPNFGSNAYIFAGVGAVLGAVMGAAIFGFPTAVGAIVIGALAGGIVGYYMLKV